MHDRFGYHPDPERSAIARILALWIGLGAVCVLLGIGVFELGIWLSNNGVPVVDLLFSGFIIVLIISAIWRLYVGLTAAIRTIRALAGEIKTRLDI